MRQIEIITGTGRCGTSALMRIFESLGEVDLNSLYWNARVCGGYEFGFQNLLISDETPSIAKDPRFLVRLLELVHCGIEITHAYLCIRNLVQVIRSRNAHHSFAWDREGCVVGIGDDPEERQRNFYQQAISLFLSDCADLDIPITVLRYPHFLKDEESMYQQLRLSPVGLRAPESEIKRSYREVVKKELIHNYTGENK